jgi:glycosyltransferase involved in cell wall biosynthesis
MQKDGHMLLSLVIPVYNESESLPILFRSLYQVLHNMDCNYELIIVNDGSKDETAEILSKAAAADRRVKILGFSRNFGHQAAITAGLDFASGDAVVVMDADLQDPPEILPEMVELYRRGYDVVSAQRVQRQGETFFKRTTASMFYWVMRRMVDDRMLPEVGDFRLFSKAAVGAIRNFREQHRFMRGLVAWLGLKEVIVPFQRQIRSGGTTKYSTLKMLRFAWTAISSFSALPLRFALAAGLFVACSGFFYLLYTVYAALVLKITVPGWTSLVALQVIFSGATLSAIGLLGDYVARIYEESKGRPLYVVSDTINMRRPEEAISRAVILPVRTSSLDLIPGVAVSQALEPEQAKHASRV